MNAPEVLPQPVAAPPAGGLSPAIVSSVDTAANDAPPLAVLFVEDSDTDALLIQYALKREHGAVEAARVDNEADLRAALARRDWDIVISDFNMPGFSGLDALGIVRARDRDLPFILVSGAIGEEIAVEAMVAGANDYVMKDNLSRLTQAVGREMRDAAERRARRSAERALLESRTGLHRAQTMALLAHLVTRDDGSFESWSETLPVLLRRTAGNLPASVREWMEFTAPEDRELFRGSIHEAGRLRRRVDIEYRFRRGDGSWMHLRQAIEPLRPAGADASAAATRWFSTLQDISEHKAAEERLRESEERFRQLAENIDAFFYLTDAPPTTVLYASPNCERIWGMSSAQFAADPWAWHALVHPQDRARIDADLPGIADRSLDREFRVVRADGTVRSLRARSFPVRDAGGQVYRVAGIVEDVTESHAQQARIARLTRIQAVLSGINSLIVRVRERDELFRGACNIAVKDGGFHKAWLGVLDDHGGLAIVASDGRDTEYIKTLETRINESMAAGRGLVAGAVATHAPVICNDLEHDERAVAMREALAGGSRALVALPLQVAGEVRGVLALHAAEAGVFDTSEMKLLSELAGDIGYALDHIEKQERLDYLAFYDALTGLANRSLFHDRLTQIVDEAAHDDDHFSLMFVNVDRFKAINDTFGRQAGDDLLKQVALRLAASSGGDHHVARLGADHFAAVLRERGEAAEIARHVQRAIDACFEVPFKVGAEELRVSATVGVAVYPDDGARAEALFQHAEAAAKRAKAAGERALFYARHMSQVNADNLLLENQLRQAIARREFLLHYQPKVELSTRRIVSAEALIRWQSPERGLVPPGRFIPLLEETGLILEAGEWAIEQAVADRERWRRMGLNAPRVAVNVSPIQLRRPDFVDSVKRRVIHDGSEQGIDLEITEGVLMKDVEVNIEKLKALRKLGLSIAIDDFGTGYSSLGYLARLPVQTLKIDRSFIIRMLDDPDTMTLVSTVISLAHALRLSVVAEGVETEEQAKILRLLRCDEMQGFLFSKPLPFDTMAEMLRASE